MPLSPHRYLFCMVVGRINEHCALHIESDVEVLTIILYSHYHSENKEFLSLTFLNYFKSLTDL
jgi:hypothetical protein